MGISLKKILAAVLAFLVAANPLMAASNLAQEPLFSATEPPANVVFMMDDSLSMYTNTLPQPPTVTLASGVASSSKVTINQGYMQVRTQDWLLRTPAVNPLWYNPAITYTPWNNNGTPFPNADYGGTGTTATSSKITQRDMRSRPNGSGFSSVTTAAGRGTLGSSDLVITLSSPAGQITYDGMPYDWATQNASAGKDLFTNPNPVNVTYTCPVAEVCGPPATTYQCPSFVCNQWQTTCNGVTKTYSSNPGSISCTTNQCTAGQVCNQWSRKNCSGTTQTFTSDPGSLTCSTTTNQCTTGTVCNQWTRKNCSNVSQTFTSDPGGLTCPDPTTELGTKVNASSCSNTVCSGPLTPVTTNSTNKSSCSNTVCGGPLQPVTTLIPPTCTSQVCSGPLVPVVDNCPTMVCPVGLVPVTGAPTTLAPAHYYYYLGTGNTGDPNNYAFESIERSQSRDYTVVGNRYIVRDAVSGKLTSRTDCAAGAWCTFEEEAQNYANWYTYYRTRLFAAIAVVSQTLAGMTSPSQQQLRIGYGRINLFPGAFDPWNPTGSAVSSVPPVDGIGVSGALVRGVRPFVSGTAERQAMFDWMFSLAPMGATPLRESVDVVGRYFTSTSDRGPWADYPGTGGGRQGADQLACRRNYYVLATDGEWTNISGVQPIISASGPLDFSSSTPINADGVNGPVIQGSGTNSAVQFQYTPASFPEYSGGKSGTDQRTLSDVTMYYWNRDLRPDLPNVVKALGTQHNGNPAFWQSMTSYIVAYGLFPSMDTATTRNAIKAGQSVNWPAVGGVSTDTSTVVSDTDCSGGCNRGNDALRAALESRGDFYSARDPALLQQAILSIFSKITETDSSSGNIGVTGSSLGAGDKVFVPGYHTGTWYGTLQAYDASALVQYALNGGSLPNGLWAGVGASFPTASQRNLLTASSATAGVAFKLANLSSAQANALNGAPWSDGASVVSFLRGDQTTELASGGKFRDRVRLLGDIVNGTVLYSQAPNNGYLSASYASFLSNEKVNRVPTVFVGANDGMLHGFRASDGLELFGYVPRGVYGDLITLTQPGYTHRYFVDGPIIQGDAFFNGNWKNIIVGSTGAGGALSNNGSIFALDVTSPDAMTGTNVLFDLTKADHADIGNVLGTGIVGQTADGQWVAIMPNGYESSSGQAALLIINLQTGAIRSIGTGVASGNGMGAVSAVYDANRVIRYVYGGDIKGNLWKFDLTSTNPAQWIVSGPGGAVPLFTATDNNVAQPITTAPRIVPHPKGGWLVLFGTGKLFLNGDLGNTATQSIYGIWDHTGLATTIPASKVSSLATTTTNGTRSFSTASVSWSSFDGWRLRLVDASGNAQGERIIGNPVVADATFTVTSFLPLNGGDPCVGGGTSFTYTIDLITGNGSAQPGVGIVGTPMPFTQLPPAPTPMSSIPASRLGDTLTGVPAVPGQTTCGTIAPSLVGKPVAISQACPQYAPMRVMRQPLQPR
jgi:type IV pilus assembly protein PilY1